MNDLIRDPLTFLAIAVGLAFTALFVLALVMAKKEPGCSCPRHVLRTQSNSGGIVHRIVHDPTCPNYRRPQRAKEAT